MSDEPTPHADLPEIERLREARIRLLALADVAAAKGRDLRLIPETRLAGAAYGGMAERIREALKDTHPHLDEQVPHEQDLPN